MEPFFTLKQYLRTELFEMELFICIKVDLALNNLQGLICHKNQTNNNIGWNLSLRLLNMNCCYHDPC